MSEQNNYIYEFGTFRLDAQKRLLMRDGEIVALKPKAFDTLLALIRADGQVVEKDELMSLVWPDTAVEEGNLTFNISSLRKALGDDPRRHEYIVTIPGQGYQFVAGVRARFDEVVVHESTSITFEEEEESIPSRQLALPPRRSSLTPLLIAIAGLVVVAFVGLGAYWLTVRRQSKAPSTSTVPFQQIAISRVSSSGKVKRAAISPDGKYVALVSADAQGDSLFLSHISAPKNVLIAGPSPTEYVSVAFSRDGDSIYYLTIDRDKGHTALYRVPVLGGASSLVANDVGPISFSPDGKQMTFVRSNSAETSLFVANVDGTNERVVAKLNQPQFFRVDWNAPAWSPDGETIASQARLNDERGHFETVVGVSLADGSLTPLTSQRWNYVDQPVWLSGTGLLVTALESETSPGQVWHIDLRSRRATRVTKDLNTYSNLSLTSDSSRVIAVQDQAVSSIWISQDGNGEAPKEISSEVGYIDEVAWMPDERIVYRSNAGGNAEIWVMNVDGSNPKQLTVDARASRGLTVSPDGRYIFFASDRGGRFNIWRVDADGKNLTQITQGDAELYPQVTQDSRWVVYQRDEMEPRLWKVSVDGGEPVQLTETRGSRPSVSPNGELIAYHYLDPDVDSSQWRIGVVSAQGGPRLKQFDLPAVTPNQRMVRWTPEGQTAYPNGGRGLAEIWVQALDGSKPRQLTNFKAEQILSFKWSTNKHTLAVVRKAQTSDAVLINNVFKNN